LFQADDRDSLATAVTGILPMDSVLAKPGPPAKFENDGPSVRNDLHIHWPLAEPTVAWNEGGQIEIALCNGRRLFLPLTAAPMAVKEPADILDDGVSGA